MKPQKGDLVYVSAESTLLKFNKDIDIDSIDPQKTYMGPAPVNFLRLQRPTSLIVLENQITDIYIKVWYKGEEWLLRKNDAKDMKDKIW